MLVVSVKNLASNGKKYLIKLEESGFQYKPEDLLKMEEDLVKGRSLCE